jgi:hypothetical protein
MKFTLIINNNNNEICRKEKPLDIWYLHVHILGIIHYNGMMNQLK